MSARAGSWRRPRAARHRSLGPGVAAAGAPTVGLPGPRPGSLPAFFVWPRERGLEGRAPVRSPLRGSHGARNLPERLRARSWARPAFQERTWSFEGLQNFPEAALGAEAVLTAARPAGEAWAAERPNRQAALPFVSFYLHLTRASKCPPKSEAVRAAGRRRRPWRGLFVRYLSVSNYAQFWANRSKQSLAQRKRACFPCQVDGIRGFLFSFF